MKFYIVRHGVTQWNALRKVQGSADIPLAEDGIRLAGLTGKALADVPFDICFTSPLIRARQTAELILKGRTPEVPVILDPRIREINFGVLEGSRFRDEQGRVLNHQIEIFFQDPDRFPRPENGENIRDVIKRTGDFWREKTADPALRGKTILIASHGCAVRALLQNIAPEPENFWRGGPPPNCSVSIAEADSKGTRLLAMDLTFHDKFI